MTANDNQTKPRRARPKAAALPPTAPAPTPPTPEQQQEAILADALAQQKIRDAANGKATIQPTHISFKVEDVQEIQNWAAENLLTKHGAPFLQWIAQKGRPEVRNGSQVVGLNQPRPQPAATPAAPSMPPPAMPSPTPVPANRQAKRALERKLAKAATAAT